MSDVRQTQHTQDPSQFNSKHDIMAEVLNSGRRHLIGIGQRSRSLCVNKHKLATVWIFSAFSIFRGLSGFAEKDVVDRGPIYTHVQLHEP